MTAYRADALHGSWVHSHEEDTADEMVFRPATRPLPPSRGRMAFDLRADGTYVERSPGPTDVPEESSGSWSLEDDRLILGGPSGGSGHAWEVTALEKDELRVRS
jgi:hypothetical protein